MELKIILGMVGAVVVLAKILDGVLMKIMPKPKDPAMVEMALLQRTMEELLRSNLEMTKKIHEMHDVRGPDGDYRWWVPADMRTDLRDLHALINKLSAIQMRQIDQLEMMIEKDK